MKEKLKFQVTVSGFIAGRIAQSNKTQRQIADECGFENQNVITMLKTGATKLPMTRIGAIAKALDVDPAYLFRLAMTEYMPDTWECIEQIAKSTALTTHELELIQQFRTLTGNTDPKPVAMTVNSTGGFVLTTK